MIDLLLNDVQKLSELREHPEKIDTLLSALIQRRDRENLAKIIKVLFSTDELSAVEYLRGVIADGHEGPPHAIVESVFDTIRFDINQHDDDDSLLLCAIQSEKPDAEKIAIVEGLLRRGATPDTAVYKAMCQEENKAILSFFERQQPAFVEKQRVAELYQENITYLPQIIVSGKKSHHQSVPIDHYWIQSQWEFKVNFSGYPIDHYPKAGADLSFTHQGKEYPIGYLAFFPKKRIDHVMVEVYGGNRREDFLKESRSPPILMPILSAQRAEHVAIVRLFLPDYLQDANQSDMTPELQECLHQGIHSFFETIKNNPEKIAPELGHRNLQNAKYFLYGASFGGRTVIQHNQQFGGTWDGYIAHAPAVSENEDTPLLEHRKKYTHSELLPIHCEEKLHAPLLILHSKDDNNVTVEETLAFYEVLLRNNSAHFVSLRLFEKGSPFMVDPQGMMHSLVSKGHSLPLDEKLYWEMVSQFMRHGSTKIPALHKRVFLLERHYTKQFTRNINDYQSHFLILAHQKFRDNELHQAIVRTIEDNPGDQNAREAWDAIWKKEYVPVLMALKNIQMIRGNEDSVKSMIVALKEKGLLTDAVIQATLAYHAKQIVELINERYRMHLTEKEIINNPEIIAHYRKILDTVQYRAEKSFFLENLFFANPHLLNEFDDVNKYDIESKECQKKFESKWHEIRDVTQHVWKESAKAGMKHERALRKALRAEMIKVLSPEQRKELLGKIKYATTIKELFALVRNHALNIDAALLEKCEQWCQWKPPSPPPKP